jgi:hypothetical protein
MTTTRKQYSLKFKARVAVEAIRGEKTNGSWAAKGGKVSWPRLKPIPARDYRRSTAFLEV